MSDPRPIAPVSGDQSGATPKGVGPSQVEPGKPVSPPDGASVPSAWGPDQTIHRGWIIIHQPDRIPELHIPHPQSEAGLDAALQALTDLRPDGTTFTVARLTWDGDLWIESGAERLEMNAVYDSLTPEDWAQINARYEDAGDEDEDPAPGGEARSGEAGETEGLDTKCDSAVPEGQALQAENERLKAEISRVNNEFGSATPDWPEAWKRVADLKQLAGDRWRENVELKEKIHVLTTALAESERRAMEEIGRLRITLSALEAANDALAAKRSPELYLATEAEARDELNDLDAARRAARAVLASTPTQETSHAEG